MTEDRFETQLAALAESVTIGPPPVARLLAGGRRRLLRRRAAVAGAALTALGVLGGGTALLGADRLATPAVEQANPAGPFTPSRLKVSEGTAPNGRHWQAWVASWPTVTEEQSFRQQTLIWQEQQAAGSRQPAPSPGTAASQWREDSHLTDFYVVVDGARQPFDFVTPLPGSGPGIPSNMPPGQLVGEQIGGRLESSPDSPDDGLGTTTVVFVGLPTGSAKGVLQRADGSTVELRPVSVGDSPFHWVAFTRTVEGPGGGSLRYYAADGRLLGETRQWSL
jgi:hypothetical protein